MAPYTQERDLSPASRKASSSKTGKFALLPSKARLAAAGVIFIIITGIFLYRLADLQVINPDAYVDWGNAQRSRNFPVSAPRGDILDRNGEPLAVSLRAKTIWADPQLVVEPKKAARELAEVLDMEYVDLLNRLTQDNAFSYLKRKVPEETADKVEALNLKGVFSLLEYKRSSPSGENLGLSVVGFVGSEDQGLAGVEFAYEEILAGIPGKIELEGSARGDTVDPWLRSVEGAKPGNDLMLTLDKGMQYEAERLILRAIEEHEAESAIVLATRPATGEILAMATAISDEDEIRISAENRAITWAYEPGSAIKALTFSAILETGLGSPESLKEVPDEYVLYDSVFTDHNEHPTTAWSISDIVTISSNVGTILWSRELGKNYLNHYFTGFGLGSPSALDLPGESHGLLLKTKNYSGTSMATIPLGQGISVTPLQLIYGFNTIANGGIYVPPRLLIATADEDNWISHKQEAEPFRVISEQTALEMTEILTRVVEEGTGVRAGVEGYKVAGKTGTARKPQKSGGYVDADGEFHYITTFAGFFPANNPQISIIVVIEEPQSSIYASRTAAPVFSNLAAFAANRFQISPNSPGAVYEINLTQES